MDRRHLAWILLLASIAYVASFYFIGSAIKPGYSQISNFVSEYNAAGTPWADTLTYAGFAATSALLSAFLAVSIPLFDASRASRVGAWLLWSLPASYFLAVIAPCDLGCPIDGSSSQVAHNLLAVVTYFGMGLSVLLISFDSRFNTSRRAFLLAVGVSFPVVFFLMVQPAFEQWGGIMQRALDVAMAASLAIALRTFIPLGHKLRRAAA